MPPPKPLEIDLGDDLLLIGKEGWGILFAPDAPSVLTCLGIGRVAGDRLGIQQVYVVDPGGVTGNALRDLRLGQVDAAINRADVIEEVQVRIDAAGRAPASLTLDDLRQGMGKLLTEWNRARSSRRRRRTGSLRLTIPETRKKPDSFYQSVANLHLALLSRGNRRPAVTIAKANDVPVSTVHRWIKEARRRGLLSASSAGIPRPTSLSDLAELYKRTGARP